MRSDEIIDEIRAQVNAQVEVERSQIAEDPKEKELFPAAELYKAMKSQHDGDAWLFTQIYRDKLCFDHAAGRWFQWSGHSWREDLTEEALTAIDAVSEAYAKEASRLSWLALKASKEGNAEEADKASRKEREYYKKISSLQKLSWKKAVLELAAAGERSLGLSGEEWDRNPWLLACKNGVIELKPFSFRPGRPSDYIKTACPTEWNGLHAPAPAWELCTREVFNNDLSLVSFVQRLFGAAIVGQTTENVLPILWGQGRNGKGTILETWAHVFGPLAGPIQAEMLLDQGRMRSSAGPASDIIALRGRRIAWASETDEGRKLNAGRVKWLCGGDTLCGREPYGRREISFRPSHTLFLITNHKPRVDASDYALWQRVLLIPFNLSFVTEPQQPNERLRDPTLPDRLKAEAPGILAWLVRGCLEWQQKGLNPPAIVKEATSKYKAAEDIIGHFIEEKCIIQSGAEIKAGILRKAYEGWCEQMGHRPVSGRKFGEEMKARFDSYQDYRGVFYLGIGLASERMNPE